MNESQPSSLGRCIECGSRAMSPSTIAETMHVGGVAFEGQIEALVCPCGEAYVDGEDLCRFDLAVAVALGRHGWVSAEAMRFVRKALGYSATNVSVLLGMTLETVSRWETGKIPAESRAFALLCRMAQDRLEGRTDTQDMLHAMQHPAVKVTRTSIEVGAQGDERKP